MGQLYVSKNTRPQGGLLSDTDQNSKKVNAVYTQSGRQLEELEPKKATSSVVIWDKKQEKAEKNMNSVSIIKSVKSPPPFPQLLKSKMRKHDLKTLLTC